MTGNPGAHAGERRAPGAAGLSGAEAAARRAAAASRPGSRSSRSYASIVRANVLTVFNAILAAFGGLTLAFGDARDALFLALSPPRDPAHGGGDLGRRRCDADPGGVDGAGQPDLRGGSGAHVAPRRARPAAQRHRVARVGRHAVHRQDRHPDRVRAAGGRARRRARGRRGGAAQRPRARRRQLELAQLHAGGPRPRPARPRTDAGRGGAVRVPPSPERGASRRPHVLPRRTRPHSVRAARGARARAPALRPARARDRRHGRAPARAGDGRPPSDARAARARRARGVAAAGIASTIAFLREQQIDIKVLSGDAPETVAAIARDVGIPAGSVQEGSAIPEDADALRAFALGATVIGRISPDGKRSIVQALAAEGLYVAMVGDGVNDVPALKASRLAIAQGSGTEMARAVSDLILVTGDFAVVPMLVAEGRQALRNLQSVSRLYVTKSAFAAFLILTIGTSSEAYPLLPRHLSLAARLTIGIPSFFLALAPSSGRWRPEAFIRDVARFAVPAGFVVGTGVVAAYLFARSDLDLGVGASRTVALTTLVTGGLYVVMALEAGGSRRRSSLVAAMGVAMAGLYVLALALAPARSFFALRIPDLGMVLTALVAGAIAALALAACGFTVRVRGAAPPPETDSAGERGS